MSKILDLRFVCYSLACFAVLGVGVFFLHKWQVNRQTGIFLAKAQEAESSGNLLKAINFYGQYLALAPRDADAQARYGSLLVDAKAYARAAQAFEAALRLDPGRSDVRRKVVKADMAIDRVPDARDHLENYLLKEFPDDAELLDLEGRCLARAGEYLAAGRSFQAAIQSLDAAIQRERDPTRLADYTQKRLAAYTQLIAILSRYGKDLDKDRDQWLASLPEAEREELAEDEDLVGDTLDHWADRLADYWTDRLVNAEPKDAQAYVFRGYRRCSKELYDSALEDVDEALKLKADHPEALHLAALTCLAAKQPDKAREFATRGVKAAPKDSRMYEILAQVDLAKQQPDGALKWLQMGAEAGGPPRLWWTLGRLQIAKGKFDEARQTAKGLREKVFPMLQSQPAATQVEPGLYADLLEAEIEQSQGHWLDATRRFGQLGLGLKSAPDLAKQAFYSLGKSYEQLADPERALKAYRQAVDADPMWIPAREALAASLQSLGRTDEALEEQSTLAKLKDAPLSVLVNLIRLSIYTKSRLSADQRDWSDVADLVNQLARSAPGSAAVPLLRAELLMAQDRAAEAEKLIETEKDKDPKEIAFWVALVDLAIRDNRWERALRTLEEAEKKLGDRVALRLVRAQYLVRKGEKGAAEQIRKLAEESKDFSAQDQVRLWRELVSASLAVDDFPQTEWLCRQVMAKLPGDLRVRLELFDMAAEAHKVKLMDAALDEIRGIESNGPIWHYATALRLIFAENEKLRPPTSDPRPPTSDLRPPTPDPQRQAALQKAREHLVEAQRLRPNWARALMLEGLIDEELHQEDAALAKYLEAVQQGETGAEVARRALRLLYGKGQYAAADKLLRQLEGQKVPFTTELFREQSHVLGGMQDYAGALKSAQQVAATSKDYRDYLWLGQVLSILGQRDEAEKALQKASFLDKTAPETWVAQVQFFVRAGQKDRAEKALADGRKNIPKDEPPLALAECLEILGKNDEAAQQYAFALKQKPDDPGVVRSVAIYYVRKGDLPKAAEQLVRIVTGQVHSTPQQLADARGVLARVRADQGGYQNLLEAIRLVEQNLALAPSSADSLRLKARLLAAHPQLAKRREALAIFEKLVEDQRGTAAEDRFRLAQLYLASGDWTKARRQLLALLAAQGNRPQYVAAYVRALLAHKETGEAEHWIDRLEQIAPDDPQAAQFRADVQFRGGKIDEALATLTKFVEKAPAGSADRSARMLAAAGELETMGSGPGNIADAAAAATAKEKAEGLFRQYVKENPKQALVLVRFFARQKRFSEALQQLEEAWKVAEPPQIAASCELLLAQPEISPAHVEHLAEVLAAALKKHDRAAPLLLATAELREKQGKYAETQTLYRELLQRDAGYVPALNNLAALLCLSGRQFDEAMNMVEKAITIAGPQPPFLDTRAGVYLALGQAEKAVADMREVVDQQPAPNRYFHLALALQKLGRRAEATDAMSKARAMQIRPESLHPLERPVYAELVRALQ